MDFQILRIVLCIAGATACCMRAMEAAGNEDASNLPPGYHVTQVMGWEFRDGLEGWTGNNQLTDVVSRDGALHGKAIDWDPILVSKPFSIPARDWQFIEIRMRCDRAGDMEFFWTNTLNTQYGGFSPGKETRFHVLGDNEWHVYRVFPFWQKEKKIILLRLDPFDKATFDVDYIRIMDLTWGGGRSRDKEWRFDKGGLGGWWGNEATKNLHVSKGCLCAELLRRGAALFAPPLDISTEKDLWVTVRMRTSNGRHGAILWAAESAYGLRRMDFPIVSDGKFHTYTIDMSMGDGWGGKIVALGLTPSMAAGVNAEIDWIKIAKKPVGEPEPGKVYFGFRDAINRAGKDCAVILTLINAGGGVIRNVRGRLEIPDKSAVLVSSPEVRVDDVSFNETAELTWTLRRAKPGDTEVVAEVTGENITPLRFESMLHFTASPPVKRASYVPQPRPVKTPYEIAAYYFPGWQCAARWDCIQMIAPIRKPVLGWYDEGNPECVDWQIKWAVEHGISIFLVDWYWCKGGRSLEHWLHDGYMKARYRKYLKFAIMWANHNPPGSHSKEDWIAVTRYWIKHYFPMEEYYRINGKPAVYIWAPANIRRDLGGSEQAAELYAISQKMAREAGYKGITFVAMSDHGNARAAERLLKEGYWGATSYHWWGDAPSIAEDSLYFPFRLVVDRARQTWEEHAEELDGLHFMPVADTGWDARPWHGWKSRVIYGRTPALWERLLREAKAYLDEHGQKRLVLGPLNEWGEGSYIEPCAEYGFKMYDKIREVFCEPDNWPPDVAPIDVGLGPYDFPRPKKRTKWTFDDGTSQGWGAMMGVRPVRVVDGCLTTVSTSRDPALLSPPLKVRARKWKAVRFRMKITGASVANDSAQLFWTTPTSRTSEAASVRMPLIDDEKFHDYVFNVSENPRWQGIIETLRFDPCSTGQATIFIDEVELAPND